MSLSRDTVGTIRFLPKNAKLQIEWEQDHGADNDPRGHPVVVIAVDEASDIAQVLITTSFKRKGLEAKFATWTRPARHRRRYLPIAPAPPHPDTGDLLHLEGTATFTWNTWVKVDTLVGVHLDETATYARRRRSLRLRPVSMQALKTHALFPVSQSKPDLPGSSSHSTRPEVNASTTAVARPPSHSIRPDLSASTLASATLPAATSLPTRPDQGIYHSSTWTMNSEADLRQPLLPKTDTALRQPVVHRATLRPRVSPHRPQARDWSWKVRLAMISTSLVIFAAAMIYALTYQAREVIG